jgi:hypothetical protein
MKAVTHSASGSAEVVEFIEVETPDAPIRHWPRTGRRTARIIRLAGVGTPDADNHLSGSRPAVSRARLSRFGAGEIKAGGDVHIVSALVALESLARHRTGRRVAILPVRPGRDRHVGAVRQCVGVAGEAWSAVGVLRWVDGSAGQR